MDVESSAAPEVSVDWRGRPCRRRHGGMRAAVFILGVQAFQIITLASVGSNLITYVLGELHFPLSEAANVVTNFVGTAFLISLLGGFLSDSYLGCFRTLLTFAIVELAGLVLLSVQANLPRFKSAPCNMLTMQGSCEQAKGTKAAVFFVALYLVALGNGCVMPNMTAFGADQFADGTAAEDSNSKSISTYFNASYFTYCIAEFVALTAVVWAQTHYGMGVGFGVSATAMAAGLICLLAGALLYRNKPPKGSIFTPIARVFVAAISNSKRKQICPASSPNPANPEASDAAPIDGNFRHANKFRFLDNACIGAAPQDAVLDGTRRPCTMAEVQQAKTLLAVLPIFACTIVSNTALAQLQTFSVQQGYAMDTRLSSSSFHIPPASLQAIPYAVLLLLVPAYELLLIPLMRRLTRTRSGISPLQRIGAGLCFSALSMVAAALVERRRRDTATAMAAGGGERMSILWLVPQFLVFGVSELFTNVGLMEFFYKQGGGGGMQAFLTALFYSSFSFGFFLSSVLVSLVNRVTARHGSHGWLGDNDLNKDRLDLFYWTLAALIGLSFLCYLVCARWYNSGGGGSDDAADRVVHKQEIAENNSSGLY